MSEIVRANVSFRSGATFVKAGDLFEADNPIVVGRQELFGPVAGAVRTTATVPGPVSSPPPFLPERPKGNASRDEWAAYVASFDVDVEGKTRDELIEAADALEADAEGG